MAQSGFTPIQLYFSTTASAAPSAGNLANGELALNITDGRLFYKDNGGVVQVLATKAGASGDVVGPGSSTDNALVRFDSTTGKLVQNSVGILDDSGNLTGIAALTTSGALTLNGGTANGVAYLNGSKVLTTGSALTFDGTTLSNSTSGTPFSLNRTGSATALIELKQSGTVGSYLGTSGSNDMIFFNGSAAELMRINSTGLGIGTSSPAYKLDVAGTINSGASSATGYNLVFRTSGITTGRAQTALTNTSGDFYTGIEGSTAGATLTGSAAYSAFAGTFTNNPLYLVTNGVIRTTLDTSGNLGLGVTPSAWSTSGNMQLPTLTLAGQDFSIGANYYQSGGSRYITTAPSSRISFFNGTFQFIQAPSGTAGTVMSSTQSMTLDASGRLFVGTTSGGARLNVQTSGLIANFTNGVDADFQVETGTSTTTIGSSTATPLIFKTGSTERARIDSSGNLLVGTTSVFNSGFVNILCNANAATPIAIKSSSSAPAAYLIRFVNNSGTDVGAVQMNASNNGVNYITLSDYRLKENIAPMRGALQKVQQLNPCTYTWKEGGYQSQGFIAHELQAVVPECVVGKKDAVDADGKPVYQGIDTSFLVATLTAAIQEQQALIQTLTARVAALESN